MTFVTGDGVASILLVEDAVELRVLIRTYLEQCGYRVYVAATVAEMEVQWRLVAPDLVLCDIQLPDGDGREAARRLRVHDHAALIFVTSCSDMAYRIQALDDGGDDYVTKPVDLRELAARVRSVLRRRALRPTSIVLGNWRLEVIRKQLCSPSGATASFTSGEFGLLLALASSIGHAVTRNILLDVISQRSEREVTERTVDTLMARIRRKIPPAAGLMDLPRPVINTVRGNGYRLDML